MNYFVEGLQGSGKSTLISKLSERHPDCRPVREGEYSPVELAWCAWLEETEYEEILEAFSSLRSQIEEKTYRENGHAIVCYTKIMTENREFYRELEKHEIYNNRTPYDACIEQQLEYLGISQFLSFQTFSCYLGIFKPDRRMYLDALEKSGVPASEAVFIDDSPRNLEGAAALDITPILIAANPASDVETPYLKIRDLRELIQESI